MERRAALTDGGSPTTVGDYRLLALIGEGGMGVVHLAQAPDGRRVALKVLRPHVIGDREARQRLAQEVGSLQRVQSPRIAEIVDADPFGETPYVATRYVPGLPLHEYVREEGPIVGADLIYFATCLAEALAAVHAVGVVHRDIKPANVLMEGRAPVLIDFGLARLAEDPRLTHTGWLLGTPGYLAPECLYGDEATPASDVHAWAATVGFAALGRAPYGTGPVMAIMDRVRRGEHDIAALPPGLRGLVEECLSPQPLDRPSLHEVRTRLSSFAGPAPAATPAEPDYTRPIASTFRQPPTSVVDDREPTRQFTRPEPMAPAPVPVVAPVELGGPVAIPDYSGPLAVPADRVTDVLPYGAPYDPNEPEPTPRLLRNGVVLALGLATTLLVAAAPYLGTMIVAGAVLLLRLGNVTRERHQNRQQLRGRPRWYDVPQTTVSVPAYLVMSAVGVLVLVGWAVLCAIAVALVVRVLGAKPEMDSLLAAIAFTVGLWWGPMSLRLRYTVGGIADQAARIGRPAQALVIASLVVSLAMTSLLLTQGVIWRPANQSPWQNSILSRL